VSKSSIFVGSGGFGLKQSSLGIRLGAGIKRVWVNLGEFL
jgi:hypothetical protein